MSGRGETHLVTLYGVLESGYRMRFPFCIRTQGQVFGLDIVEIGQDKLGQSVVVVGRKITVDGITVLTEVVVDGTRLPTVKEWDAAHIGVDPFHVPCTNVTERLNDLKECRWECQCAT